MRATPAAARSLRRFGISDQGSLEDPPADASTSSTGRIRS
jgi:hypothetical protein